MDLFDGNNEQTVNGQISFTVSIPNGAKKFEFCYKVSDWQYNAYQSGHIDLFFEHGPNLTYESNCSVYFLVNENTDGIVYVSFEIPTDMYSVTVYLRGTFTAHIELYPESVSVETASTENTGIVRPTASSAISVVANDQIDSDGNVIAKAGDIDVKVGDGINKNEKGELCTTSDLSGSNWQSLDRYTNGFIVNGAYYFERESNGNLVYKNANRTITITSHNETMPEYVAPTTTGGETNAV